MITIAIIVVTVLVSYQALNNQELFNKLKFNPYMVTQRGEWYRTLTVGLVHADYMHLGFNMYVLYLFGDVVETVFRSEFGTIGSLYFLIMYIGGLAFSCLPTLINRKDDYLYNSVGASGAVSGIVYSYIIIAPWSELMLLFIPIPINAVIFGAIYLVAEYFLDKRGGSRIAHGAHFYGAIFGIIYTILIHPQYGKDFLLFVGEKIGFL